MILNKPSTLPISSSSQLFEHYSSIQQQQQQQFLEPQGHDLHQLPLGLSIQFTHSSSERTPNHNSLLNYHEEDVFSYSDKIPKTTSSFQIYSSEHLNNNPEIVFSNNQCNKSLFNQQHSTSKEQFKSTAISNSPQPREVVDSNKENFYPQGQVSLVNLPKSNPFDQVLNSDINIMTNQIPNQEIHRNNQLSTQTKEIQFENFLIQSEHSKNQIFHASSCLTENSKQNIKEPNKNSNVQKQINNSSSFPSSFQMNIYHNQSNNRAIPSQYIENTFGDNIPSNERNISSYQSYEGSSNNYATSNNLPNITTNQTSSNHINYTQSQLSEKNFNQEIDQSGYNDNYSNYYYPFYSSNHGELLQRDGLGNTEEYQKYQYCHPFSGSYYPVQDSTQGPISAQPSGQTSKKIGSSHMTNFQGIIENPQISQNGSAQDQQFPQGYYDHKTQYPHMQHYQTQTKESHPIVAGKKQSKKSSFGSNHSYPPQTNVPYRQNKSQTIFHKSNSSSNQPESSITGSSSDGNDFQNQQFMSSLNQDQQIYCDPSYFHSDQIFKKPSNAQYPESCIHQREFKKETNISYHNEKNKSNHYRNSKQQQMVDPTDPHDIDNQESSHQNNQSTSHEIRKRKRKNNDQLKILKIEYQKGGFWGKEKILEVAQITGLSESQVYKWCWDQKKKRLETFKKRLGTKLITNSVSYQYQEFENMSADGLEEDDSYKQTGSPDKLLKLNDQTGAVAIKANISKLSNDFTISQLQEKVLAGKSRVLQNITEKVMSRQNSQIEITNSNQVLKINNNNKSTFGLRAADNNNTISSQFGGNGQENINPEQEHLFNVFQQPEEQQFYKEQHQLLQQKSYEDVTKRLHFYSAF